MASMPTKIVLKSTTSMSLNERFSSLPKPSTSSQQQNSARAKMVAATQASQANRRLAQQMTNRPSVQAALKKGKISTESVKQRLGSPNKGSVKARLSVPIRGRGRGRGLMARGRGSPMRARGGLRAVRGGKATVSPMRGGGATGFKPRGGRIQRGGQQIGRGMSRGAMGPGRGAMRGRGMSRGTRGRGRGGRVAPKTKEQLDTDLDSYMSKSKAHLDAELDAYMATLD